MRVCYVLSTSGIAGGANRSLVDLLESIDKTEFESHVIIDGHGSMEEYLLQKGIPCKVILYFTSVKQKNKLKQLVKAVINWIAVKRIKKYLLENKIDILHNNSLPTIVGMQAAAECHIPFICHVREYMKDGLGMEFISERKAENLISGAAAVIYISDYIKNCYREHKNKNSFVVYDGIRAENYLDSREILRGDKTNVIMVGVINPQKGQLEAVSAVKELVESGEKNVRLFIVGTDGRWNGSSEYAENVHRFVEKNGLNEYVRFTGEINGLKELAEIRKKADITLVCSKAEGLGRTTVEGMLAGTLVLAANLGATPEIIENGINGVLFDPGEGEISRRILQISREREAYRALAERGREDAADRFSCDRYAKTISNIYRKVVRGDTLDG